MVLKETKLKLARKWISLQKKKSKLNKNEETVTETKSGNAVG
jgi:hypothetical protein